MADSLPMAQIPNFSLGATPTNANLGQGIATGVDQGAQLMQRQQELEMAKQQQTIQQVDTLLKSGIQLPGLLPSFWPTIATKMNSLSPDYKLDPNNPPPNLLTFSKSLSDISDGVNGGVVSMPQAHNATTQLIKQNFPTAQDALGAPDAGGGVPSGPGQNMSPAQPPAQGPQGAPPQGGPQSFDQMDFPTLEKLYGQANAIIPNAPTEGPQSQANLRDQLANSPLGIEYKKRVDLNGQTTLADKAHQQSNMDAARSLFSTNADESRNALQNGNTFIYSMQGTRGANLDDPQVKQDIAQKEQSAFTSYIQMNFPGSRRPANFEAIDAAKDVGSLGTQYEQMYNRLKTGQPLTPGQANALTSSGLDIIQSREKNLSDLETAAANNAQSQGVDPNGVLTNFRPSNFVSTSKFYPAQSSDVAPLIGHTYSHPDGSKYRYAGGNKKAKDAKGSPVNWLPLNDE